MQFPEVVTRRTFLAGLAAWGGAGAILLRRLSGGKASVPGAELTTESGDGIPTILSTPGILLDRSSAAIFERYLGTAFRIIPGPRETPQLVHLTEVTRSQTIARPGREAPGPTPSFSLIFRSSSAPVLLQDTYQVEHAQLGAFPLFLVPIGLNQADACYQAIFA